MRVFRAVFSCFCLVFEQKSVKIRGLKSFLTDGLDNIKRTFNSLPEILIFKINLSTLTIKSYHDISTFVRRGKT